MNLKSYVFFDFATLFLLPCKILKKSWVIWNHLIQLHFSNKFFVSKKKSFSFVNDFGKISLEVFCFSYKNINMSVALFCIFGDDMCVRVCIVCCQNVSWCNTYQHACNHAKCNSYLCLQPHFVSHYMVIRGRKVCVFVGDWVSE